MYKTSHTYCMSVSNCSYSPIWFILKAYLSRSLKDCLRWQYDLVEPELRDRKPAIEPTQTTKEQEYLLAFQWRGVPICHKQGPIENYNWFNLSFDWVLIFLVFVKFSNTIFIVKTIEKVIRLRTVLAFFFRSRFEDFLQ